MAKAKVSKKLNATTIKKAHGKKFTQKKVVVEVEGNEYEILIDEKFEAVKMQQLAFEGLTNFKEFTSLDEGNQINYFSFLILKYFTNVDVKNVKKVADQLELMNSMLNLGIIGAIFDNMPAEEIHAVGEHLKKLTERVKRLDSMGKPPKDAKQLESIIKSEIKDED